MKAILSILLLSLFINPLTANAHENNPCETSLAKLAHVDLVKELFESDKVTLPFARVSFRQTSDGKPAGKFAVFASGEYVPSMEEQLQAEGFNGIVITKPSNGEVLIHNDFLLMPLFFRWVMKAPQSEEAWIASLPSSSLRNQMKRKLKASTAIRYEVAPLTFADYVIWREQLYVPEILGRNGGMPFWRSVELFAQQVHVDLSDGDLKKQVPGFMRTFFYSDDGKLIGGMLISNDPSDKSLTIRAAAFQKDARAKYELAIRGISVLIQEAKKKNYEIVSYGKDVNPYGIDATLGLEHFKASIGMNPITFAQDGSGFELVKIFDSIHSGLRSEGDGTYQGLLAFSVKGTGGERLNRFQNLLIIQNDKKADLEQRIATFNQYMQAVRLGADPGGSDLKLPQGLQLAK